MTYVIPSQCLPLVPGGHSQSYSPSGSSLHLASFLQGFGWQGWGISYQTEKGQKISNMEAKLKLGKGKHCKIIVSLNRIQDAQFTERQKYYLS